MVPLLGVIILPDDLNQTDYWRRRSLLTTFAHMSHQPALEPEDLARFFVERANAGDVEGLVALYEPEAVLAFPGGQISVGTDAIRAAYTAFLATGPVLPPGTPSPALRNGDVALTSTKLAGGGATAEIARRQPDGTWPWAADQPSILP